MSQTALPRAAQAADRVLRRAARDDRAPGLYDWSREVPEWAGAVEPHRHLQAAGSRRSTRPVPAGPPRLTRRGRIVLYSLLGTAAAAGCGLLSVAFVALSATTADASTESLMDLPERSHTLIVNEGDTLWEIAERIRPAEDPRKTVDELVEINNLTGPVLTPGQELVLPSH
ncbi:LysM peptidoglycan-binding domain-containing protein [Thermobifida cellulosilytica]|uniref:Peptidoglycan-binding LysM n=1 Tax=Thermobifida cellulosilytica TB100 TaxID=665004 RepID=A0A147KHI3_THECS|nr:LysM peptidoglycan-binding domain-containing protein [Thermobifida cellulosilytica]KUP96746.1 peptidoglycan-binding LysM [Thermobifida cellulosilytica TB100]